MLLHNLKWRHTIQFGGVVLCDWHESLFSKESLFCSIKTSMGLQYKSGILDIVRLLVTRLGCLSWRYARILSTMTKTVKKQTCDLKARRLKRAVSRLSIVHFQVNNANYASLFAVELEELLVNNKTTASCQANITPKHYVKPYQRLQTTTKNKLWKTVMLTSFQKSQ